MLICNAFQCSSYLVCMVNTEAFSILFSEEEQTLKQDTFNHCIEM